MHGMAFFATVHVLVWLGYVCELVACSYAIVISHDNPCLNLKAEFKDANFFGLLCLVVFLLSR